MPPEEYLQKAASEFDRAGRRARQHVILGSLDNALAAEAINAHSVRMKRIDRMVELRRRGRLDRMNRIDWMVGERHLHSFQARLCCDRT
jgi:hypothetical protein